MESRRKHDWQPQTARRQGRSNCRSTATTTVGIALLPAAPAHAATGYTALTGSRLYDSRSLTPFANGETRNLAVAGVGGVPAEATAVVLNVTAVSPTGDGFFTVWPAGQDQPGTSNVNFGAGSTVPNAVVVQLGSGGAINLFNFGGTTHMLVDVTGYFVGGFIGVTPTRLLDTRSAAPVATDQVVQMAGRAGIPLTGVAGVMLNVTIVSPSQPGYTTVFPEGAPEPNASNLNFVANDVVANAVGVGLGANGSVHIAHRAAGTAHYLVDVFGYFPAGSFVPLNPSRVFETRKNSGGRGLIRDGETHEVGVAGVSAVPASGVGAVLANVTVVGPTRNGYVSVWPNGAAQPNTSVVNFRAGQTKPNLAVLTLGNSGAVNVFVSNGSAHVLIDVLGYFPGVTSTAGVASAPIPVPTLTSSLVAEFNAFRAVGRTCAYGTYTAARPVKVDDTLMVIAQNYAQAQASGQGPSEILDATINNSEYRALSSSAFSWAVVSGPIAASVSGALGLAANSTSGNYCNLIYGPAKDAGIGFATSATGRNFLVFVTHVPSYPSTFPTPGIAGSIVSGEPNSPTEPLILEVP